MKWYAATRQVRSTRDNRSLGIPLRDLAVSTDGRLIAAVGEDGIAALFHRESGAQFRKWQAHAGTVRCAAFETVLSSLITAGEDQYVAQWRLDALRAQFALVSQDVVMFNDTLAANIALESPPDAERLERCIDAANLRSLVESLPQGLDTVTGHNATELSGGQRQRLAIARALYKDAPILILDEATSALDTESERHIQQALQELMENRTTFVIAHRLSTVESADRIIVMSAGEIVEAGTHAELLAAHGQYATLHRLQFRDEAA